MSKNGCELCTKPARMFCESDQASLCWDCDERVHAANFLVAKHSRTLLCNVCRSPTPWKASGLNIGPTVSLCHGCAVGRVETRGGGATTPSNDDGGSDSPESESDDGEYCSDSEGSSEDGENQVVPWSDSGSNSPQPKPPPPPGTGGSSCEANGSLSSSSKRRRRENNFESEDEDVCCSSRNLDLNLQWDENCSSSSPTKRRRSLPPSAIVEKLR